MIVPQMCNQKHRATPQWLSENVPFVNYATQNRIGKLIDPTARLHDIELKTQYELDSTQALLRFVRAGHGWAIVTGLSIIPHPKLLEDVRIPPLANSANARYLSLLSHKAQLGTLPGKLAMICQEIYRNELVPKLSKLAPWFGSQA